MIYKTRLLVSSLLICSALVACGDNDNEAVQTPDVAITNTESSDVATTNTVNSDVATTNTENSDVMTTSGQPATTDAANTEAPVSASTVKQAATSTSSNNIEAGMTTQAVTDLLGEPTLTQTHTLDSLTMIHSEWTDKSGTTSVQFQNGIVQFSQFTPAK